MTTRRCIRFLRRDLQQDLLREITSRSVPHDLQPDGTICADGTHVDVLDEIVENIIDREIPDWEMHWVNPDDRDAWRDHMTRSQIPFIEYETDGDPSFIVPAGYDPDPSSS